MALVEMTAWQFLVLLSVGIFSTLFVLVKPKKRKYAAMLKLGVFLALFDFAFETWGFQAGYWASAGSILALGAVPAEVFVIALLAGATYAMVFKQKFSWELGITTSILIASAGTIIEALLAGTGNLVYTGGWNSGYAAIAYFLTFLLIHGMNSKLRD